MKRVGQQASLEPALEDIVERVQSNDDRAFDELVARTQRLVRKIAAPLLPPSAVDDAVRETYIIVFQKFHHLRSPDAFRGWLSRIALNVCYQWRRRNKPTVELKPEHSVQKVPDGKIEVRGALEQLKQKDRDILILREYLGLSYEEITEAINLPEGTVRSRLHYARKILKEQLIGAS